MSELTPAQREALEAALNEPRPGVGTFQAVYEHIFAAGIAYATKRDAAICRSLVSMNANPQITDAYRCARAIEGADRG